jgi:hypothetical protein
MTTNESGNWKLYIYNLVEIVADYKCRWSQHSLRMKDAFPMRHMGALRLAKEV